MRAKKVVGSHYGTTIFKDYYMNIYEDYPKKR